MLDGLWLPTCHPANPAKLPWCFTRLRILLEEGHIPGGLGTLPCFWKFCIRSRPPGHPGSWCKQLLLPTVRHDFHHDRQQKLRGEIPDGIVCSGVLPRLPRSRTPHVRDGHRRAPGLSIHLSYSNRRANPKLLTTNYHTKQALHHQLVRTQSQPHSNVANKQTAAIRTPEPASTTTSSAPIPPRTRDPKTPSATHPGRARRPRAA